jgi:hypothetical protein
MTTLNLTGNTPDISTNINTFERLLLHNVFAAQAIFGGATFNLDNGPGTSTLHIQNDIGYIQPAKQFVCRTLLYLPIDSGYYSNPNNLKPWTFAKEITSNPYLAAYR